MPPAWSPQLGPQTDAITATWCQQLLYGGARGGGKSDFILGDYLQDVERYGRHWQGILFRRTLTEFEELIRRSHEIYPPTGAKWLVGKNRWSWPNGAMLRFRYLERDQDAGMYQGHQYPWIGWEELGNFPSAAPYKMLLACNRWAEADIPVKRVRASANPGGVGHGWIKHHFIDHSPLGYVPRKDDDPDYGTGDWIMFIPAKVADNKILLEHDPNYIRRLRGVGSPEMVRAWLEGDWSAIIGSYYPEFGPKHIIEPFEIPKHWTRFRAMDWGSAKPFVVQWMTVSDGSIPRFPTGAIIVYREWYGGHMNVGLKLSVEEVAAGILERQERGENISYTVVDPAMFIEDGGPSLAETMGMCGVACSPADNKRIPGWAQLRNRLIGHDDKPMFYVVGVACPNLVRTLPSLQHDAKKPEDVNTEGDDHCGDTARYGCMSRPYTPPLPAPVEPIRGIREATYEEIIKLDDFGSSGGPWGGRI